jgi:hypothetical protein
VATVGIARAAKNLSRPSSRSKMLEMKMFLILVKWYFDQFSEIFFALFTIWIKVKAGSRPLPNCHRGNVEAHFVCRS